MTEEKDRKNKFALYVKDSTLDVARQWYEQDDCRSLSEFIEKAIMFYAGYVASEKNENYLPSIVVSTLKSIVRDSENRQNRNLYKIAVELNVLARVIATIKGTSAINYESVRSQAHKDVRKCNGTIAIEDAVKWQNS